MGRMYPALAAALAATAIPLAAQEVPASPPAGAPTELPIDNRGMGAITNTPGEYADPRTAAESALLRSGKKTARGGEPSQADLARYFLEAIDRYVAGTDKRRLAALADAGAQGGAVGALSAKDIRSALDKDLAAWRDAFGFDKATWQDQRAQWLTERAGMTAADWAARRAAWFAARDAWIAGQRKSVGDQAVRASAPN